MPNVLISIKYYYQIKAFFRKRYERVYNLEIELLLHDVNIMVAFGVFGTVGFYGFYIFIMSFFKSFCIIRCYCI